jgi:hypothetical protein
MKNPARRNGEKGFIALTSTVILSAALMLLMYSTSASGFYARFDAMAGEFKRISLGLSESCVNAALLRVAQNYQYVPASGGDVVPVGSETCIIRSVEHAAEDPLTRKKQVTIYTAAKYPAVGGSWSTSRITATAQNPIESVTQPAPVCLLQATPTTVQAGDPITVQWSASGNSIEFALMPAPAQAIANPADAQSGTRTFIAQSAGTVEFIGRAKSNAGVFSAPCTQTIEVTPAPALACADTVMMLDRTPAMQSTDLAHERSAARGLIDLYDLADSDPQIGVGSFVSYGISPATYANVSDAGWLSASYGALKSLVDSITAPIGAGGTCAGLSGCIDISEAIAGAHEELESVRHNAANQKVLLLVSNGKTNHPASDATDAALAAAELAKADGVEVYTVLYDGENAQTQDERTLMAQLASGSVPVPGYAEAGSEDNSATNANSGFLPPSAAHAPNTWTNATHAFSADSTYASDATSGHQQGYGNFNFAVPSDAILKGIEASITGFSASTEPEGESCEIETSLSWNGGGSWTSATKSVSLGDVEVVSVVGSASDTWGRAWTSEELSDGNFVLRLENTDCAGTKSASVNAVAVKVYYTVIDAELENDDGDNFFIVPPTSLASIADIFNTIGHAICPAAAPACANGADDDGDSFVDIDDPSCHVGETLSGAYSPTDSDEWTPPAPPPLPGAVISAAAISIGSWDQVISPNPQY